MKKLIILIISIILLAGCSADPTPSDNDNNNQNEPPKEYVVGNVQEDSGISIKVNSTRVSQGNEYFKPEQGKVFFIIDITLENKTDEEVSISSLLSFELKDADGRDQEISIFADLNGSLDGKILPNEKMTGEIAYETSAEGKLYLYFTASLFSGKTLKFTVR